MPSPARRNLLLLGVFCLVPLLNFPRALVSDRTLFLRDIGMVWAPQSEAVVQQVASGHFPFFDGKRAFGQPLFADPRSEVLYPPAWIHLLLTPDKSFGLFCAFHIVIAALGAARLTRRLCPDASLSALATAGLAYGAGGPVLSLVSHWHHLAAAAWMPWIIERADPRPGQRVPWLSLSGLVALQVFAGSPDYTFITFVLCLLRVGTRTDQAPMERFRTIPALLLGLALAAIQLLPSLAFAHESAREPYPIGWAISPLHPALTLETILPVRVDSWPLRPEARAALLGSDQVWMFSHYLGLSVWVLSALGLVRFGKADRRFLAGSVLIGLVLAWGVRDESLQSLIAHLPLVSGLRFPTKHLAASSLALAVLAAQGVMTPRPWPARSGVRIGLVVLALFAACAALFAWSRSSASPFEWRALLEPSVAILTVAGLFFAWRKSSALSWLFPALVAIDLLCAHASLNPTTPSSFFRDRPPLTRLIPAGSRIYVSDYSIQLRDGSIRMPLGRPYQLGRVPSGFKYAESLALAATWYLNPPSAGRLGYFGSFDLDILDFYRAPLKRVVETFVTSRDPGFVLQSIREGSVEYVVTMDPPGLWDSLPMVTEERRFFEAPVRVYKVPDPWPRARFETLQGELDAGSPEILSYADARIVVSTAATKPTRLVVAVANDRGWRATIDGTPAATVDNRMVFLSVPVGTGAHVVAFTYWPPLFAPGVAISALSLLIAWVLTVRSQTPEDSPIRV
ncbi:MAG: YfhO family protein [Vicinamibacteria bacterium]